MTEFGCHIASECSYHQGLYINEDCYYVEIIDPKTGEKLPDGEYGEIVVTNLRRDAMPLIRYRTRDITRIISEICPCGRTHKRIEPITHRIDDMIIINGVNIFPSQIEECLYKCLSSATNYLIRIKETNGLKKMYVDVELSDDLLNSDEKIANLNKVLKNMLKSYITISPILNFVPSGTFPEVQGKINRVIYEK